MISELNKILSIQNLVDKKAYFMSLLTRETEEKNIRPIVVGGSAVDFYTEGIFPSYDIDLVGNRKVIGDILENIFDFKRSGRHWINEELGIYVEVPGEYLAGNMDKVTTIKVNDLKLYVIGIEDLITKYPSLNRQQLEIDLIFIYESQAKQLNEFIHSHIH